jgi:RNA-directed DNA polymerase
VRAKLKERTDGIRLYSVARLAATLGLSESRLREIADSSQDHYREFERDVKGKSRLLTEATGPLKMIQRRILDRVLLKLEPFESAFGAVKGRSIKENANMHLGARFIAKLDIKAFYPSIRHDRVYTFFLSVACSPDVARILTLLVTRRHTLPLGTSTSPFLADQVIRNIDLRINGLAKKAGLIYSRYVDDITISGSIPLTRFKNTVLKILKQTGFKAKASKLIMYGPGIEGEQSVTGVRIDGGRLSAPGDYVDQLEGELRLAMKESRRHAPQGEFSTREHYFGRITYVRWLDKPLGGRLLRLYRRVRWRHLEWYKLRDIAEV